MQLLLTLIFVATIIFTGCAESSSKIKPEKMSSNIVQIESRKGVTQKFILIVPENPVAAIVLLPGHNGKLELSKAFGQISIGWLDKEFLVKSRESFARNGFIVAVVDAPSDRQTEGRDGYGGLNVLTQDNEMFRMCDAHAQDIAAIVSYLKTVKDVPTWIVGNSMGTISAANASIRAQGKSDGLILTSSKTRTSPEWGPIYKSHPNALADMDLQSIRVPTLIVHHKNDTCESSAPEVIPMLENGLNNALKLEVAHVTGGKPRADGCSPFGAHSFYGIDQEVIEIISKFILSNL
jgi:hypothetical protein